VQAFTAFAEVVKADAPVEAAPASSETSEAVELK
jgi:hypothetical protein